MRDIEREWERDIRNGDREAFKAMFCAYYADLCAFASKYVEPDSRAEDIVQDVFLNVWENREQWTIHTSIQAYLYRAVRNRAMNRDRRERIKQRVEDQLEHSSGTVQRSMASDRLHFDEITTAVQRAIDQLPERRRMVFLLHRRHDFTYAEIAEIMDIAPKTVENQMGRALKFLRTHVESKFSESL